MGFRNLKIGRKLILGFGVVIFIVIAVGGVSIFRLLDVAQLTENIYNHPLKVGYAVRDIKANINAMHRSMKDVALAKTRGEIESSINIVNELEKKVFRSFKTVFERFLGEMTDVQEAFDAFGNWKIIRDEVIKLRLEGKTGEAAEVTKGRGAVHVASMNLKIQKMIDFASFKAETFLNGAKEKKKNMIAMLLLFFSVMILLVMLISFFITRSIVVPLKQILKNIRNISNGILTDEIEISSGDEVGMLADSCRELQQDLKYRVGIARKIINGDLSGELPPRSDEDELGQTFYKMSQSIRSVTRELSLSEQKLRNIMDSAPVGVLLTDERGKIVDLNRTALNLLGYEKKNECHGLLVSQFFLLDSNYNELQTIMKQENLILECEFQLKKRDGGVFWGSVSSVRKELESGEINYITIIVDLTSRKLDEMKILESEARYRSVFNTAGNVIVCLNRNYEIIEWNMAAENVIGYPKEEIVGKNYMELIVDPEYSFLVEKDFVKVMNGLPTENFEYRIITSTGEGKFLLWNVTSLLDSGKSSGGIIAIGQDISERKRVEKEKVALKMELIQAQKMESLGTLAGGIAHDFNNILSVIMGYAEISVEQGMRLEIAENIEQIMKASKRAKDMVSQILAFSRKTDTKKSFVRLSDIIKESISFMRASLNSSIKLEFDYSDNLDLMYLNSTQINQIIMNLCANAAHAIGDNPGCIRFKLEDFELKEGACEGEVSGPGKYQKLTIKDNGAGMEKSVLERVFEPYFTTKVSGEGSGMGLAVVYGIIKSYGGNIKVDSALCEGTTFTIYLPIPNKGDVSSKGVNGHNGVLSGTETIMFVDDESALVDLWDMVLKSAGYTVGCYKNSITAFSEFKKNPDGYDLIVTDINMPDMNGLKLLENVKKIREKIPVILCTGYTGIAKEEVLNSSGIDALLIKPVSKNIMLKTIRDALDNIKPKEVGEPSGNDR